MRDVIENYIERLHLLEQKFGGFVADETLSSLTDNFVFSSPLPMWLKDKELKIVYINAAYTNVFGVTLEDYVGYEDGDNWEEKVANAYRANDQWVLDNGQGRFFTEYVLKDGSPDDRALILYKFPVLNEHGEILGVGGICVFQDLALKGHDDRGPR